MFAAVIADAGVMDLLRYPLFTIGAPPRRGWPPSCHVQKLPHLPCEWERVHDEEARNLDASVRGDHPCPCTRSQVLCARGFILTVV